MCLNSYDWLNFIGSAIGGFIGVIIFFLFRFLIEFLIKRKKKISTYWIVNDINKGQKDEQRGEIMHHHGKLIDDNNTLSTYSFKYPVWEWSEDKVGKNEGTSIFYGPYSTDLYEPGNYEIKFFIKGICFSKEVIKDCNILEIDVNELQIKIGSSAINTEMNVIGKKYIKASELSVTNEFSIFVYSNGKGIWEYRAFAFDGNEDRSNNIEEYKDKTKIFFEKIEIYKLQKLHIPWN